MNKQFAGKTIQDIVQCYSDMLLRIAFQNMRGLDTAEDIVQEVYIKLMKQTKPFTSDEHLKAWLIRVTVNLCKDYYRSSWFKRTVPLTAAMDFFAPEEQKVMEEIFSLKVEERNIIYLHYYEGYTIREIASILEKNENTISSKLQRSRKKLRSLLEEGRGENEYSIS